MRNHKTARGRERKAKVIRIQPLDNNFMTLSISLFLILFSSLQTILKKKEIFGESKTTDEKVINALDRRSSAVRRALER